MGMRMHGDLGISMNKLIVMTLLVVQTSTICFAETSIEGDKKGIYGREDISKLPATGSDKSEKHIKPNRTEGSKENQTSKANKVVDTAIPERAKNAVMALKKLQARCQSGTSLKDFAPALGEAKSEVTAFVNSNEAKDRERLKELVVKAMGNYQKAGDSMRDGLNSVQSLRNRIIQAALQGTEVDSSPLLLSPDGQAASEVEKSNDDIVARYIRTASYILVSIDKIIDKRNTAPRGLQRYG